MPEIKVKGLQLPGSEDVYIFSPDLATDVTNNPGAPVQAGAAADAKAVADALDTKINISSISQDLTSGDFTNDTVPGSKAVKDQLNSLNQKLNNVSVTDAVYHGPMGSAYDGVSLINAESFGGVPFKDFCDKTLQNPGVAAEAAATGTRLTDVESKVQTLESKDTTTQAQINDLSGKVLQKNTQLDLTNHQIKNLAAPTVETDAINGKSLVEGQFFVAHQHEINFTYPDYTEDSWIITTTQKTLIFISASIYMNTPDSYGSCELILKSQKGRGAKKILQCSSDRTDSTGAAKEMGGTSLSYAGILEPDTTLTLEVYTTDNAKNLLSVLGNSGVNIR